MKLKKTVDVAWMLNELQVFIDLTVSKNGSGGGFITVSSFAVQPRDRVLAQWVVVKRILDRFYPTWEEENLPSVHYEFQHQRDAVFQCIAILRREEEISENLGEAGPNLSTRHMHPWVWLAAAPLWRDGHYGVALQAAATSLNAQLQDKIGRRDISGKELINEAFSKEPAQVGKPRLMPPDLGSDELNRNSRNGLRELAAGCNSLIRNIRSHTNDEISEFEALEELATLSYLARKLDECAVRVSSS